PLWSLRVTDARTSFSVLRRMRTRICCPGPRRPLLRRPWTGLDHRRFGSHTSRRTCSFPHPLSAGPKAVPGCSGSLPVNLGILALWLCSALPAADNPLHNLDFAAGTLAGWEGQGFAVTSAAQPPAVFSADSNTSGRTGRLQRTLLVPGNAATLRCKAYAVYAPQALPDKKLDIVLRAADD